MRPPVLPADWPYRAQSHHIRCTPHLWHVQDIGNGPTLLLIHGAGGATHSFRHLIPLLPDYRIIAVDMPGQGFSLLGARNRCGLDAMATDLAALARQEHWQPVAVIGHSAGAAIALRLAELMPTGPVIGINAALGRFEGVQGWLFPAFAKLLALTPLLPTAFSKFAATPAQARQIIASTGSQIDALGEGQYLHLMQMPSHVSATVAMMAQWNLDGLLARLPGQTLPCLLITAARDRAVPNTVSQTAAAQMPHARWVDLGTYGHLVHEEAAAPVATLIRDFLAPQVPTSATPTA